MRWWAKLIGWVANVGIYPKMMVYMFFSQIQSKTLFRFANLSKTWPSFSFRYKHICYDLVIPRTSRVQFPSQIFCQQHFHIHMNIFICNIKMKPPASKSQMCQTILNLLLPSKLKMPVCPSILTMSQGAHQIKFASWWVKGNFSYRTVLPTFHSAFKLTTP